MTVTNVCIHFLKRLFEVWNLSLLTSIFSVVGAKTILGKWQIEVGWNSVSGKHKSWMLKIKRPVYQDAFSSKHHYPNMRLIQRVFFWIQYLAAFRGTHTHRLDKCNMASKQLVVWPHNRSDGLWYLLDKWIQQSGSCLEMECRVNGNRYN